MSDLVSSRRCMESLLAGLLCIVHKTFPSERLSQHLAKESFTTGACPGVCSTK